jgi:hypothetical protein
MKTGMKLGLLAAMSGMLSMTGEPEGLRGIATGPSRWIKTNMTPKMIRARRRAKQARRARKIERLYRKH